MKSYTTVPFLLLCIGLLLLSGCAMNQNERDANLSRTGAWQKVNHDRSYKQTEITGIESISGTNMKITTWGELDTAKAPDIQYDTSDTDLAKAGLQTVEKAVTGAVIVGGAMAVGDALRPDAPVVVTQPEPVIVQPEVVYPEVIGP